MGKSFTKGENSKKAAGNAKVGHPTIVSTASFCATRLDQSALYRTELTLNQKAEAVAKKQEVESARLDAVENSKWSQGSKSNSKKEDAAAKKAEAAQKKAERDAQLAVEEAGARSAPKNSKSAVKKTAAPPKGTLDLSQLDAPSSSKQLPSLNASGIDSALDALSITTGTAEQDASKVDRHPERRFRAAYAAFEAKRLPEIEAENPGLRRQQRIDIIKKEFDKSPDNPFNQVSARFDSTREEIKTIADKERRRKEGLLED